MRPDRYSFIVITCVLAIIVATAWIYSQGLAGGFVFDDYANLPSLGTQGPIDDTATFLRFITSGTADPTGRPVALLSFLIDGHDWPTGALPFKRTNIIIHLINGALLAWLLLRLGHLVGMREFTRGFAACVGAGVWLFHPLLVSTVLYVVQREAMLPATFVLLGLHLWLLGRAQADRGRGAGWLLVGIPALTLLALLSKANGILLPLLIIVTEFCLPELKEYKRRYQNLLHISCLPWIALILAILTWLAVRGIDNASVAYRGWSITQRLLTEPSIVWVYLGQLWLVIPAVGSVFHDQYTAATDLWRPFWTLPAIIGCIFVLAMAVRHRRTHPALSMTVLFYFAGNAIESTSLPLELYFEHRNYLPAMLMFWPMAASLADRLGPRTSVAIALITLGGTGVLSLRLVNLWGNPYAQAMSWAAQSPDSARAQAYAAQVEASVGRPDHGIDRLLRRRKDFPAEPQVSLSLLNLRCQTGTLDQEDVGYAVSSLRLAVRDPGRVLLDWSQEAVKSAQLKRCSGLNADVIEHILDAAASNPVIASIPGRMQDIEHIRGDLALARGDTLAALTKFNNALRLSPTSQVALGQAASLGGAGAPQLGLQHLSYFETLGLPPKRGPSAGMAWIHDQVLDHQNYWGNEVSHLKAALASDARNKTL